MRFIVQMSEQDVREVLAKHFDGKSEDVKIHHKMRTIGQGMQSETEHYIEVEVNKKFEDTDLG